MIGPSIILYLQRSNLLGKTNTGKNGFATPEAAGG